MVPHPTWLAQGPLGFSGNSAYQRKSSGSQLRVDLRILLLVGTARSLHVTIPRNIPLGVLRLYPGRFLAAGLEFLRTMVAGIMTTCVFALRGITISDSTDTVTIRTGVLLPVPAIATFETSIGVLSCSYQPTDFEQPIYYYYIKSLIPHPTY